MKLLIGYGNTLRQDDGVGCRIAIQLTPELNATHTRVILAQQLLPELAADVAQVRHVVFVDAEIQGTPGTVQVRKVMPLSHIEDAHALTPSGILLLSQMLYGVYPCAHLVTVTGATFELGETLSMPVQNALPEATAQVRHLMGLGVE